MPDSRQDVSVSRTVADGAGQPEVVVGSLIGFTDAGAPLVDWPANPVGQPVPALSACSYGPGDLGRDAALLFVDADPSRPLVVGLISQPLDAVLEATRDNAVGPERRPSKAGAPIVASIDGERLAIEGKKEIVLRCGKASITLTRAGKILIRGAQIVSRASGQHRIKGGSVQIN